MVHSHLAHYATRQDIQHVAYALVDHRAHCDKSEHNCHRDQTATYADQR